MTAFTGKTFECLQLVKYVYSWGEFCLGVCCLSAQSCAENIRAVLKPCDELLQSEARAAKEKEWVLRQKEFCNASCKMKLFCCLVSVQDL